MLKMITRGAVVVTAISMLTATADAADLGGYRPPPAQPMETYVEPVRVFSWRGFYAGINGGYAWGSNDPIVVNGGAASGALAAIDPDGWLLGGQVGYNMQFDRLVLGVEADLQGGDVSGGTAGVITPAGVAAVASSDLNWLSTVRARAGIAHDRMLFYVTGGVAWADMDYALASAAGTAITGSDTATGYVVGGGVEWALAPNWTAKAEYLYIDLDDTRITGIDAAGPATASFDNAMHSVRVGLNYKF
ncbi:MAG: porin family protein [Hyphomicrobiaceae bacterium]|nr:porin family protein [Hyphomicrobiaceae bacterium]